MPGTRPKLNILAHALLAGLAHHPAASEAHSNADIGMAIRYQLANHYRTGIGRGKPSRAAHYKRLAKKRANARARSAKK